MVADGVRAPTVTAMSEANGLLRAARERTPSRRAPGEHMSRAELAEAVCSLVVGDHRDAVRAGRALHRQARARCGPLARSGVPVRAAVRPERRRPTTNWASPHRAVPAARPRARHQFDARARGRPGRQAGDESVALLALAEESNVGDLTVEQLHADILPDHAELPARCRPSRCSCAAAPSATARSGCSPDGSHRTRRATCTRGRLGADPARLDVGGPRPAGRRREPHPDRLGLRRGGRSRRAPRLGPRDPAHGRVLAGRLRPGGAVRAGRAAVRRAAAPRCSSRVCRRSTWPGPAVIDDAREALHNAKHTTDPHRCLTELGGPFLCTPERAEGIWSDAHLALGEARYTLEHADHGVAMFEAAPHAARNFGSERMVRLQQAKAHLQLGELDGATEASRRVLATPVEYRVRPLIHRISEVAALDPDRAVTRRSQGPRSARRHPCLHPSPRHRATPSSSRPALTRSY